MDDKVLLVDDIQEITKLHKRTIQRYFRDGRIKGTKIFGKWMTTQAEFNQVFSIPPNVSLNEIVTQ